MTLPHYDKKLNVRPVAAEDLAQARAVAGRAFGEHCEKWYPEPARTLGGFDGNGQLVSVLEFQLETLWWGAARVPGAAVGGVATDPASHGKGCGGGLMVQTIHYLRDQGACITPLWPFSFRWYGKFGWACPGPVLKLKAWPDLVRQTGARPGSMRQATGADAAAVQRLYTRGARLRNGQTVRSAAYWEKPRTLAQIQVIEGPRGALRASAQVSIAARDGAQGRRVRVREMHGDSFSDQLCLLRSLAELEGITLLELNLPAESPFVHAFAEQCDMVLSHEGASRVLDVKQALEALKAPKDLRASFGLEVADWVVQPKKPLAFAVQVEDGEVQVKEGAGRQALCCDINTFTRLFSGGLSTGKARQLGWLQGGGKAQDAACDALLHGRVPYRSEVEMG